MMKPAIPLLATPPRKKKSSAVGDAIFLAFCASLFGLIINHDKIPIQKWEVMTLPEHIDWAQWMAVNFHIPVALSVVYVVFVFGVQWAMSNPANKGYELRVPLGLWSLVLTVFSVAGAVRTVPMVYDVVQKRGVMHLVCGDTRFEWLAGNPAGFWTLWFCLSKIPELFDTAFIVFRKKPIITLHWYHHFTVMLFCWQAWATCCMNGLIFAAMNLTVHSVMYFFYALTAFGYRPTTFAQSITLGQITQMVVGTTVTAYVVMDKLVWHPVDKFDFTFAFPQWMRNVNAAPDGGECHVSSGNALAGFLMYTSYFLLFAEFYYTSYLKPGSKGE